ncbi:heavy metal-binding protein [Ornithinibacillus sp. L9]|uniref:Heavy metal-binding protein n=1 Tax=Ornithinibacillus caprae TaxID=2678566 RepID=A0A6N8FKI2_9BACI|nr:heavy-metal-associated domain-containing protein [Ornithinibacillus caprae]MUK87798.1 heavy metal-binding protein [Ornithinibacillus caprae]
MTKAVFQLEALTCPSCIKKIESTLDKMDGIESAKVLFNASKVKVQFDEKRTTSSHIEQIIEKLGYPVLASKVS